MEVLKIENLSFSYPGQTGKAVDNISFSLEKGEFLLVCGSTGSGKSTLLGLLKSETAPSGEMSGRIVICGKESMTPSESARTVGFVAQRPEQQIVTDKVWHELAFGLENLGVPTSEIRSRVAEMASYFGIDGWFMKDTASLSGGQKQILNLAAGMVMRPEIIVLDEPTSQLDPIATADFTAALSKINRDLGVTVVISEHKLGDVASYADKLLVMESGRCVRFGEVADVAGSIDERSPVFGSLPAAARVFHMTGGKGRTPLNVREGRAYIEKSFGNAVRSLDRNCTASDNTEIALRVKDVYFRYGRNDADVLDGAKLDVQKSRITCILGGNGSGKSTLLKACAGIITPYSGSIEVFGKPLKAYKGNSLYRGCLSMLPQDVQTLFCRNTVLEELKACGADKTELPFELSHLYAKHPYDLSGGEQQLLGLAIALASAPSLLLLDEPTKGVDAAIKSVLADAFAGMKAKGMTVVAVTHDMEFASLIADRCALLFRGAIVSSDTPARFFRRNSFYTTDTVRMTSGYYDGAVTVDDAAALCRANGGAL